jgi:AcrR family transcriptional regulator
VNASRTARERARAELTREIKDEARRQLAAVGAARLSLRSVARALGLASSALYRYYSCRDDLLTALIIDAYEDLGDAAEAAANGADPRSRWLSVCRATRRWALSHPHEYALIYGSPVPGYRAPQETVLAAARVPLLLIRQLQDAWAAGALAPPPERPLAPPLAEQVSALAERIAPDLPAPVMALAIVAWTQLFGMISFELFGHLVGGVDPSERFFDHACQTVADLLGLPEGVPAGSAPEEA